MKWTKSRKFQQTSSCMRSNETNPSENQLSIALCRDVNMTIWHVRDIVTGWCQCLLSIIVVVWLWWRIMTIGQRESLMIRWRSEDWIAGDLASDQGPDMTIVLIPGGLFHSQTLLLLLSSGDLGENCDKASPAGPTGQVTLLLIIQQSLRSAAPWLNVIINTRTPNNKMIIFHWEINISRWTDSNNAETRRQG